MNAGSPAFFDEMYFLICMTLDALLVASTIFTFAYATLMLARAWQPLDRRVCGHPAAIPFLFVCSLALVFTPAGEIVADAWQGGLAHILDDRLAMYFPAAPVAVWLAVTFVFWIRLGWKLLALRRELAGNTGTGNDPAFLFACDTTGFVPGDVRLNSLPAVRGACSWGLGTRRVIVPAGFFESYSGEERYCIYLHELLHIRRRDTVKYALAAFFRSLFWFHPVIHLAAATVTEDIEIACDAATVRQFGVESLRYARLLVKAQARIAGLLPPFSRGCDRIRNRLGHLTGDRVIMPRMERGKWCAVALAALCMAGVAFLAEDAIREKYAREATIHAMPDGSRIRFSVEKVWDGALGSYCRGVSERVE